MLAALARATPLLRKFEHNLAAVATAKDVEVGASWRLPREGQGVSAGASGATSKFLQLALVDLHEEREEIHRQVRVDALHAPQQVADLCYVRIHLHAV